MTRRPSAPPEKRRAVPLKAQRDAALRQLGELMRGLGFEPHELDLHHEPPLALRPVCPETGRHQPHQHDSRYLVWMPKAEHRARTTGRKGASKLSITFDGDVSRAAKVKRVAKNQEEFRARLLAKSEDQSGEGRPERTGKPWPSRPLKSRNTFKARDQAIKERG